MRPSDPAGADFTFTDTDLTLSTVTDTVALALNVSAPRPGVVIVNTSSRFLSLGTANESARCSITTGTVVDPVHFIQSESDGADNYDPISITRGFEVLAGTTQFRLMCNSALGSPRIDYSSMTAAYYPIRN